MRVKVEKQLDFRLTRADSRSTAQSANPAWSAKKSEKAALSAEIAGISPINSRSANPTRVLSENAVNIRANRDFAVQIEGESLHVKVEKAVDFRRNRANCRATAAHAARVSVNTANPRANRTFAVQISGEGLRVKIEKSP